MLASLHAERFRNLEPLDFEPGAGRHLLFGGNGAGKTSLLEAVYVVATTRSFRTPRLAECIRHGEERFMLAAEIEDVARAALVVGYGPQGRERTVNGELVALAEHLEVLPVVPWTGADVEIVSGPPARRRRFLDRGVVSLRPGALATLRRYRDALAEKRELLALQGRGGRDDATLCTWNRVLAETAVEVRHRRATYTGELKRALSAVLAEASLPFPAIELGYRPSPASGGTAAGGEAAAPEEATALAQRLDRAAPAERRRGIPLLGPHRDELAITWGGRPADEVTSAGERKALSLALVAAHGRVLRAAGREPLYLLDDLDAELAPDTLAALWTVFGDARQLLATSNRPAVWQALPLDHGSHLRGGVLKA
jgi:DNA replication and repair protein RecF